VASLKENIDYWEKEYRWIDCGDEWSNPWGSPRMQWYGSILPRIREYLPVGTILEIAPGFGRWTNFLSEHCNTLKAVDASEKCVAFCRKKFHQRKSISIYQNNGNNLDMIQNDSIDFVFSFDSFVHFDLNTVERYLAEISRTLKHGGIGFIHHSNLACRYSYIHNEGWRSVDVSHKSFEEACSRYGLACILQEVIPWSINKDALTDCFTVFTKSKMKSENIVVENSSFFYEIEFLRSISNLL
jgi:ubiquinone/menaquinone biosynthesis C-methylase UbiE